MSPLSPAVLPMLVSSLAVYVAAASRGSIGTSLVDSTATNATFDYVIIGGGTAGLVVAARLSENPNVTVAVVEAGIHHIDEPLVDTPEMFGQALGNPAFDWGFTTAPQEALGGTVMGASRGKMLGGSSGLNFLAWDRGSAKEYDAWHKLGASGWSWDTMLPYFKKSESALLPPEGILPGDERTSESAFNASSGRSGPVQTSYNVLYSNLTSPFVEAATSLGIWVNNDPYAGNATGLYNTQSAIDRVKDAGRRSYAASTYYSVSKDRPNLTVFLGTQATRINFSRGSRHVGAHLRAESVDVVAVNQTGFSGTLAARRDVILSAGAIQTPQLLELSGIGGAAILKDIGIETLVDLPGVGENLQDHPLVFQDFELSGSFSTFDVLRNNATFLSEAQAEYAKNRTGIFAADISILGFLPLHSAVSSESLATIRRSAYGLLQSPHLSPLQRAQYHIQLGWLHDDDTAHIEILLYAGGGLTKVAPASNKTYVTINSGVMHPFSRGSVHINSTNPLDAPIIDPRYLDADVDFHSMLEATKFAHKITKTAPLADAVAGPHAPPANMTSDAGLTAYLKANLSPFWHHAGTAAMVPQKLGGVVDPTTLTVYGTANLRVVDASLIPLQFAAHTQATIYAIAERASDIIKGARVGGSGHDV
ncbi:alcohol oxidase [Trametes maxima]|nr:alcohol oxidase [Trametes maxima]